MRLSGCSSPEESVPLLPETTNIFIDLIASEHIETRQTTYRPTAHSFGALQPPLTAFQREVLDVDWRESRSTASVRFHRNFQGMSHSDLERETRQA